MSPSTQTITVEIRRHPYDISLSVESVTLRGMGSAALPTVTRIVLYEEDDLMRALLTEWLRDAGYGVQGVVADGIQTPRRVDLLIVSLYMPKHTGAKVIREFQSAHPGTPLIALSGQFRGGLSSAGLTARTLGAAQLIAKPLTRDALLRAVRAMIGAPN
jgi:DNA-binding response OmpR family regulator